jgi:hypothetical protein
MLICLNTIALIDRLHDDNNPHGVTPAGCLPESFSRHVKQCFLLRDELTSHFPRLSLSLPSFSDHTAATLLLMHKASFSRSLIYSSLAVMLVH